MPFDLHSACTTLQKLLDALLYPEMDSKGLAYLDDITLLSKTWEEHKSYLESPEKYVFLDILEIFWAC